MLPEPEDEEAKAKVKAKRILTDSIKGHLIPNVSELKTAKEMFDALIRLTLVGSLPFGINSKM
jgi:hypothetical protein